jgi:hypothetical protein
MKNGILKMIVLALLLGASGSTSVLALDGGEPAPLCFPKPVCVASNAR